MAFPFQEKQQATAYWFVKGFMSDALLDTTFSFICAWDQQYEIMLDTWQAWGSIHNLLVGKSTHYSAAEPQSLLTKNDLRKNYLEPFSKNRSILYILYNPRKYYRQPVIFHNIYAHKIHMLYSRHKRNVTRNAKSKSGRESKYREAEACENKIVLDAHSQIWQFRVYNNMQCARQCI